MNFNALISKSLCPKVCDSVLKLVLKCNEMNGHQFEICYKLNFVFLYFQLKVFILLVLLTSSNWLPLTLIIMDPQLKKYYFTFVLWSFSIVSSEGNIFLVVFLIWDFEPVMKIYCKYHMYLNTLWEYAQDINFSTPNGCAQKTHASAQEDSCIIIIQHVNLPT